MRCCQHSNKSASFSDYSFCSFVDLYCFTISWWSCMYRWIWNQKIFSDFSFLLSWVKVYLKHTRSSCVSVSFTSTVSRPRFRRLPIISNRFRVHILILPSRSVFFAAVSSMWFHFCSCLHEGSKDISFILKHY